MAFTRTKVFAAYLPQYHETAENNEFWGEGFTDWDGVRNAEPLFSGHEQPRVPLNNNYYDLSCPEVIKWQAELAREHFIDGFNIYHYWFEGGHAVLDKPAQLLREQPEIDIQYFFSWDNTSWVRSWSNILGNSWAPKFDGSSDGKTQVLLKLDYGGKEEWKEHFDFLLPFFLDKRYYKIDGKPVFVLMRSNERETLEPMAQYWNTLAQEQGLSGVYVITGRRRVNNANYTNAQFIYEPGMSAWGKREMVEEKLKKYLHVSVKNKGAAKFICDYQKVWKRILASARHYCDEPTFLGGIVSFDDTPRRGSNARVILGDTPEAFEENFAKLYRLSCDHGKEMLFLTAWNEWGEGAYLEPDIRNGLGYLQALKNVLGQ